MSSHPPSMSKPYRLLKMVASSLPAYEISKLLEEVGFGTTADCVLKMRKAGVTLTQLSAMCRQVHDPEPVTAYGHLRIILRGSPMFLEVIFTVISDLLPINSRNHNLENLMNEAKMMICMESPWLCFVLERVLQTLLIPSATRYGNSRSSTRLEVSQSFRSSNKGTIQILIQPYTCGREGVNLDGPCRIVLVAEPATSGSVEDQTVARVHRVSFKFLTDTYYSC